MPIPRSPEDRFHIAGRPTPLTLGLFWQWAASDLTSNALRGVLAEFLVGQAVGCLGPGRLEWDACDLRHPSGLRLEVKASGYLQSWAQSNLSKPSFDIAPKRSWDALSNTYASSIMRSSDVYVFALHAHTERETLDPLNIDQWRFYVVATATLNARCAGQKRIGLPSLTRLAERPVSFLELAEAVAAAGMT